MARDVQNGWGVGFAREAPGKCWTKVSGANRVAATFLENQARRFGCKGVWVGSACRVIPLAFTTMVLAIAVASLRGPAETNATPTSSDVPSQPGRSLRIKIDTATKPEVCWGTPLVPLEKRLQILAHGLPPDEVAELERSHMVPSTMVPTADVLNFGLKNVRASADEHTLYLSFDYDLDVFHRLGLQRTKIGTIPLLIRLFDAQGEHLTHFTTAERFAPASLVEQELLEVVGAKNAEFASSIVLVSAKGNQVAYPINARDLQFASIVEIGFDANGSPATDFLTGTTVKEFHATDPDVEKAKAEYKAEYVEALRASTVVRAIKQRWAEVMKPFEEELGRLQITCGIGLTDAQRELETKREEYVSRQASLVERENKWRKDLDTLLESKRQAEARGQWFSQQWNLEIAQQRLAIVPEEKEKLRLIEQDIGNRESAMPNIAAACAAHRDTWNRLQDMKKQEKAELEKADAETLRTINAD